MRGTEDGSSPITAIFGFVVFLSFLLGTVQLSLHLFASSAVSSAAFDATRSMAAENGRTCGEGIARARELLGGYGSDPGVQISCPTDVGPDEVALRITAPSPAPLLDGFFGLGFDLGGIDREVRMTTEQFRAGTGP